MGNLNKKELAEKLHEKFDKMTKTEASQIINAIFSPEDGIIAAYLCEDSDNKVTIPSFGTFSTRKREERVGRHPAFGSSDPSKWTAELEAKYPGGKLPIPASHVVTFKAGKGLKGRAADLK